MTQWSAFVGFTGVVLTGFLALARLSQQVVDDDARPGARTDDRRRASVGPEEADDRTARDRAGGESLPPGDADSDDTRREPDPTVEEQGTVEERATVDEWTPDEELPTVEEGRSDDELASDNELTSHDERTSDDSPASRPDGRSADGAGSTREPRDDEEATDGHLVTDPAAPEGPIAPAGEFGPGVEPRNSTQSPDRAQATDRGTAPKLSPGALLANVALTQGLFGGLLAAAAWYFGIPGSALGLSGGAVSGPTALAVGVGFGVVLWVGNELATAFADEVGATYDEGLRAMLAPDDVRGWVLLLGATLPVIAVVEEFLFRAAAVGVPSAAYGGAWALAVVSSVAFALGHGAQGRVGVVVTGALGFALAAGFVLTGSFVVVVVAHYLVNALEFVVHEGVGLPDPVWSSPG